MDLLLIILVIVIILAVFGGFAFSHLLWILAAIALIVIVARFAMGRRTGV